MKNYKNRNAKMLFFDPAHSLDCLHGLKPVLSRLPENGVFLREFFNVISRFFKY